MHVVDMDKSVKKPSAKGILSTILQPPFKRFSRQTRLEQSSNLAGNITYTSI